MGNLIKRLKQNLSDLGKWWRGKKVQAGIDSSPIAPLLQTGEKALEGKALSEVEQTAAHLGEGG